MKQFLSFIHKALLLLAVATISVAFEGCSEVADKTIDGIKDLPAQIIQMATPETVESVGSEKNMTPETAATEYNYIYFRYNNQWVTNKLISYEVVDNEHIFPLDMFINSDYLLKLSREEFAKELKRLFDEDIIGYAQVVVATDIHDMHRIVVLTDPTQMDKLSRIAVSLFGVPKREARRIIAKYQAQ